MQSLFVALVMAPIINYYDNPGTYFFVCLIIGALMGRYSALKAINAEKLDAEAKAGSKDEV